MNKEMEKRRDKFAWVDKMGGGHIRQDVQLGWDKCAEIYEKEQSRLELLLIEQTEKVVKLKEQVGPLVEALKFYADNNTHKVAFNYNKNIHQARLEGASPIFVDSGAKACETLKRLGFKDG